MLQRAHTSESGSSSNGSVSGASAGPTDGTIRRNSLPPTTAAASEPPIAAPAGVEAAMPVWIPAPNRLLQRVRQSDDAPKHLPGVTAVALHALPAAWRQFEDRRRCCAAALAAAGGGGVGRGRSRLAVCTYADCPPCC